jgi:hypothetical protein
MFCPMTPIFSTHPDLLPYERRITEPQHKEVAVLARATAALQRLPPALSTRTARSIEDLRNNIKRFLREESARGRPWFGEVDGVTTYMMERAVVKKACFMLEGTQPATTQPATTQPATTQPATTQPATTQPATTQPATMQQRRSKQRRSASSLRQPLRQTLASRPMRKHKNRVSRKS